MLLREQVHPENLETGFRWGSFVHVGGLVLGLGWLVVFCGFFFSFPSFLMLAIRGEEMR